MTRKLLKYSERALTKAVDQQGWTPLHFAAFFGYTSIVIQLLECDKFAAYVGDKDDKKIALHIATTKGHLDVVKELTSRCPDCFELVDQRGRNVLHYAFEYKQYGIAEYVTQDPWLCNVLLNGKDVDRNTPFHSLTGPPAIIMDFMGDARVDKMAFNKNNLNPYDIIPSRVLAVQQIPLQYCLKKKGARPGRRRIQISGENDDSGEVVEKNRSGSGNEEIKQLKETHLVAAALIATVTFAAGLALPGGFQQGNEPEPGVAVLRGNTAFGVFLFANTTAMCTSTCSVLMHLYLSRKKESRMMRVKFNIVLYCTTFALIAMVVAFLSGTYAVLGKSTHLPRQLCFVGSAFFTVLFLYQRVYKSIRCYIRL